MRRVIAAAVGAVLATTGAAPAQGLEFKPIDTSKYVVQPADAATNIFSGTSKYLSRTVASTIDSNGVVRTVNNLLGRRPAPPATTQPGFSPLPHPGTYQSSGYKNSFVPAMPTAHVYGQTPR